MKLRTLSNVDSFTSPDPAASDTANFHLLCLNLQTLSKVLHKLGQLVWKAGLITSFFASRQHAAWKCTTILDKCGASPPHAPTGRTGLPVATMISAMTTRLSVNAPTSKSRRLRSLAPAFRTRLRDCRVASSSCMQPLAVSASGRRSPSPWRPT